MGRGRISFDVLNTALQTLILNFKRKFVMYIPAFANKDATVVKHHPRMKESEVAEEVSDLALSARVRPVDDLHCAIKSIYRSPSNTGDD